MLKRMIFVLTPFILLVIATYTLPYAQNLPNSFWSLANALPYLLMLAALGLAWRFNRSRILFSTLLLFITYLSFAIFVEANPVDEFSTLVVFLISILLPFNIAVTTLLKERGIFTQYGSTQFAFYCAQIVGVWWLASNPSTSEQVLTAATWTLLPAYDIGISQPVLFISLLVVIYLAIRIMMRVQLVDSMILSVLLLSQLALTMMHNPQHTPLIFSLIALLLMIVLVQESYGMAYIDELTGLPGRRAMMGTMASLGNHFSIAMIDIDHFKKFNDTHGHDVGDQVLRMVAGRVGEVTGGGRAARYGGEEFSIIFPGKGVTDVFAHLEVVRQKIEESPFSLRGNDRPKKVPEKGKKTRKRKPKQVTVTVSIGVAERSNKLIQPADVMKAADKALYRAKEKGRNQVCK